MMKNKKGFTLVELLAVIVVLAIIMSVAGSALLNQRKKSNIEEAKKMENDIKTLGVEVYALKKEKDKTYTISELVNLTDLDGNKVGLLKSNEIKNPNGNGNCKGYLEITADLEFIGHICCPKVYETGSTSAPDDCNGYRN